MRNVEAVQAQRAVEAAFRQWGMPRRMRFDNGSPFANTMDRTLPTALALWLASLGVEVILNRPYSPQQNGSVECTQRISRRWANLSKCQNAQQLQKALDQVVHDHIHVLRQRSKADQTRAQQYPELFTPLRVYNPDDIVPQRAKDHLAARRWYRKVYKNGRISLFNQFLNIGGKFAGEQLTILYNPIQNTWEMSLTNGQVVRCFGGPDLSIHAIRNLTIFSKNFTT